MLAVQERLPLSRALPARARRNRQPFHGGHQHGDASPYRLPHEIRDRLIGALQPFRNRESALSLAVFLGRYWSMPGRVALPFPIDRRALTGHRDLGLTEAQVRGAIRVLEEVGFLARFVTSGSRYKPTEDGLHRKPIPFQFGSDYAPLFIAANARAAAARGRREGARRILTPKAARGPSLAAPEARALKSPKLKGAPEGEVIMGEIVKGSGIPPRASVSNPNLEAALDRLKRAAGIAGDGSGEGSAR
jgi:hypothetical protein